MKDQLVGKIVHYHSIIGAGGDRNFFCIVIKDNPKTVQLFELKDEIVTGDCLTGTERPLMPSQEELNKIRIEETFRAKKIFTETGEIKYFYGKGRIYDFWNGQPAYFYND